MSEDENPAQIPSGQNNTVGEKKKRHDIWSAISLFSALAGLVCLIVGFTTAFEPILFLSLPLFFISLICGIIALAKIQEARKALIGLLIAGFAFFLAVAMPALGRVSPLAYRLVCSTNLSGLEKAIYVYAQDHNNMLPSQRWCDDLIKGGDLSPKNFVCKTSFAADGQSSYAFNKNLIGRKLSEINPNTVMIFETHPGWNQVGGPEILSIQNHEGKGCNILFADGHVEFVITDSIPKLRWEP
jgi:prepilin-type processing-associated H-X9-DG protein